MRSAVVVSMGLLALAAGCSTQSNSQSHQSISAKRLAPTEIRSSFATVEAGENQQLITIQRSSLGRAFLMTSSMVTATNTPILDHLLPKVVAFEENGDHVALFELNAYAVYGELPSDKLIQTFPIVSKTADSVSFKMDVGFTSFSMKDTLGGADFPSSFSSMTSHTDPVIPTVSSFVRSAKFNGNEFEINQVSRIRASAMPGALIQLVFGGQFMTEDFSVHLTTRLKPYRVNEQFEPKLSTMQKGVGYFEVAGVRPNEGKMHVLATRWDFSPEKGPVTYAISKNVPADVADAVKEGVLYWNIVAGREIVKVEMGAEPNEIPGYRRAMVRWIPWDGAGFARAAILPDPITGEILSADVYLTSAWNLYGQRGVPRKQPEPKAGNRVRLLPSGFASATECDLDDSHAADATLDLLTASVRKPELVLKATQDMIRTVTAHEVGHTLGLRHNFAGSLMSELRDSNEHMSVWAKYLEDEKHEGAAVTTSVMDYLTTYDDYLAGAAIKSRALAYDAAAIQWGYLSKGQAPIDPNTPAFCTDMEASDNPSIGCERFDSSQNPIQAYAHQVAMARAKTADMIVDGLLGRVFAKHPQDRQSLRKAMATMNPETLSASLTRSATSAMQRLKKGSKALAVKGFFGETSWMNRDEVKEVTPKVLSRYFEEAGGLPGFLTTAMGGSVVDDLKAPRAGWLTDAVKARMAETDFMNGKTVEGVAYRLNDDQAKAFAEAAVMIAEKVEEYATRDLILAMTGTDPMAMLSKQDDGLAAILALFDGPAPVYEKGLAQKAWRKELAKLASEIIAGTGAEPVKGKKGEADIQVPAPAHPAAVRLASVRLFSDGVFQQKEWMTPTQNKMTRILKERLASVTQEVQPGFFEGLLGAKPQLVLQEGLSPEIQKWAADEMAVLAAVQNVDAAQGNDMLTKLLIGAMLGISYEEAGVPQDALLRSLEK